MDREFSISVVIPNFNGAELLRQNLPSVYDALKIAKVAYEIIIADDASTDQSVAFIRSNYPDIKIIENTANRGFAPTVNAGIFSCSKELVFLLNSDVRLTGDYFSPQFLYFKDESTFGVMGRIIGLNNDKIQDAAKPPYKTGLKIGSDENLIPVNINNTWFPTLYLSGANALVNRKKLIALEGFDEVYAPFYGEDLDLSVRAWKAGWKCYYEHNAVCRHPNSVTINKYNKKSKIKIIVYRNRFIMHDIHLSGLKKIAWNIWLGLQLPVKAMLFQKEFLLGFIKYIKLRKKISVSKNKMLLLARSTGTLRSNEEIYHYIKQAIKKIPHHNV